MNATGEGGGGKREGEERHVEEREMRIFFY
jgi:hypothetical protein